MQSDIGEIRDEIPARVLAALLQQARAAEDWQVLAQNCGVSKQEVEEAMTDQNDKQARTKFSGAAAQQPANSKWLNKSAETRAAGEAGILKDMFAARGSWFMNSLKSDLFECNEAAAV